MYRNVNSSSSSRHCTNLEVASSLYQGISGNILTCDVFLVTCADRTNKLALYDSSKGSSYSNWTGLDRHLFRSSRTFRVSSVSYHPYQRMSVFGYRLFGTPLQALQHDVSTP